MAAMVTTGNGSCHLVPIFFGMFWRGARFWEFKLKFLNAKTIICAWFLNMCTIPLPSLAWSDCWSTFWIASAALGLVNSNPEWLSGSWRWCCNLSRLTKAKSSTGMQTGLYPTASKAWRKKIKKTNKKTGMYMFLLDSGIHAGGRNSHLSELHLETTGTDVSTTPSGLLHCADGLDIHTVKKTTWSGRNISNFTM